MISQVQQNIGIFISVIPGARMLRMVVTMLIEPMIDEAPMMCMRENGQVHAHTHLGGKRRIQRPAGSRGATRNKERDHEQAWQPEPAARMTSYSSVQTPYQGAPICIGISQLAKPTKAGMMAPNTMMRPCIVVSWLKNSGINDLKAGLKQLGANRQRQHAAGQEHDEAEPKVQRTNVLVVGGHDPTHEARPVGRDDGRHGRARGRQLLGVHRRGREELHS